MDAIFLLNCDLKYHYILHILTRPVVKAKPPFAVKYFHPNVIYIVLTERTGVNAPRKQLSHLTENVQMNAYSKLLPGLLENTSTRGCFDTDGFPSTSKWFLDHVTSLWYTTYPRHGT